MTEDTIEQELMRLPDKVSDPGTLERIERGLVARAKLEPLVAEPAVGLLSRRVPVWSMLVASLLLACGAGALGWSIKSIETTHRMQPSIDTTSRSTDAARHSEPIVEFIHLDRPLFDIPERDKVDPSRWTMQYRMESKSCSQT